MVYFESKIVITAFRLVQISDKIMKKKMKSKDIVKFKEPANEEEENSLMVVLEMRGNRVLVSDLRFSDWNIPPTDVYSESDLEVVTNTAENKVGCSLEYD